MEKELRDELAMGMNKETLPTINTAEAMEKIAKAYNIDVDFEDEISMIKFAFKYQAIMRYEYADAMLAARKQ